MISRRFSKANILLVFTFVILMAESDAGASASDDSTGGSDASSNRVFISKSGQYHLRYQSKLEPVIINQIHSWVIQVTNRQGHPLQGAEITLEGGMPEHDHGMPTRPVISESLEKDEYVVEGIRFHMRGQWELVFNIMTDAGMDTLLVPLEL